MNRFELVLPRTIDEAKEALTQGGVAKAGGIDLVDRMKEGVTRPDRIVSLEALRAESAAIEAGPAVAEVAAHAGLRKHYGALARAAADAATPQVRNRATAGGNLLQEPRCWYYRSADFTCLRKGGEGCPAKDGENAYHAILGAATCPVVNASNLAPALVALGAEAKVRGRDEALPVEALWPAGPDPAPFHALKAGEILLSLHLPPPGPNAYVEIRQKQSFDFPLAAAAVARQADGWRVVLGAVAPIPWRARESERILGAADPDADLVATAADAAVAGARPLSQNAYKLEIARVAVRRALTEAAGGGK